MIVDHIEAAERYFALHPLFPAAFLYLRQQEGKTLTAGRHEIGDYGDQLYAMVNEGTGAGEATPATISEAHRRYLDIHFTLTGTDGIGCTPATLVQRRKTEYDEAADYELFEDLPLNRTLLPVGTFMVCYPADVHAPGLGEGPFTKIVIKLAL